MSHQPTTARVFVSHPKETAQTTHIVNRGDTLFTTFYPNPGCKTVVLLHGGPGFPSDLPEVVECLRSRFQLITFHQRGTRQSPCPSRDYSMNAYLSDIEAVRQHYGVERFHLWGHSWGGLYAQIYADRYPDALLSLFLCCPGSGTNLEWKQTEHEVMQLNRSKCTSWEWVQMGWNNLLGMLGSDRAYERLFTQVMKNYNHEFIQTDYLSVDFTNLKAEPINRTRPEILKYPLLPQQPHPPFPVTIVYGDGDIYQSSKNFVLNRYPTATVQTITHCGHIPWLHNPTDYKAILQRHYTNP
ncbi:alpha/beta fold hydrolase [Rudanella paleaurantiibacter]|uniref:Alpha/beta fold hydrolase n=1 Tax=Rudanella paleaurantiibacter TaxID=2614655 RepID=A0A7J5TZ68_9BACT|nr:alpha/beta hydrolase [Rudanella paleaurantiibacter]KAB7730432.1 alpha/beta fold hydrolase [Rudanella paleaurantiibacter]